MSNFHTENIASILNKFDSNMDQGLSAEALEKAKARYGKNEFASEENAFPLKAFLRPLLTWRIIALALATGILIAFFSSGTGSVTLRTIGIVAAVLGIHIAYAWTIAYRSCTRNANIKKRMAHSIKVIRQGKFEKCPPEDIVPGDLLSLTPGDYVPADARIIEAEGLMIDESALFGTEGPAQKLSAKIPEPALPPEQQKNIAFGGTYVVAGHAFAIVVRTGKQIEIWKQRRDDPAAAIANTRAENETRDLHTIITIGGIAIAAVAVVIGWWFEYQNRVTDWYALILLGLLFTLASAPANVIGLIRLAFSKHAEKLREKGITLRHPNSLEKLSRITLFCANENGLATTRALTISSLFVDEQLVDGNTWRTWLDSLEALAPAERQEAIEAIPQSAKIPQGAPHLIFTAGLGTSDRRNMANTSNSDSATTPEAQTQGTAPSPQATIQTNMERLGYQLESVKAKLPLVDAYPSTRNYGYQMQVFESAPDNYLNVIFGDAQTILNTCGAVLINGEITVLSDEKYEMYREIIDYLLSTKSQVYGVAFHTSDVILKPQEIEDNPIFLGFISFSISNDEETKTVLKSSLDTGLKIILISESKEQETVDLAKDLGLVHNRKAVASREELEAVPREQIDEETANWFAYSQPTWEQRRNIVLSLKRQGHAIGFLGQNRTDLRAMTAADIALANSAHASHVVQAAADGLISSKGFQAVRDALLHAREAYHNAAGFLRWNLSCTLALLFTLTIGTALHYICKMPMPLTLTQLIWVQLLTTLLPSLGMGTEQIFADADNSDWHHRPTLFSRARFLSRTTGVDVICRAVTISLMALIPFFFMLWRSPALSDTIGVSTLMTDVFATGNGGTPIAPDITIARTVVCTTLILTQLATSWQALRYPWESLFRRMFANSRLLIISCVVIALHLATLYIQPVAQFLEMAPLKWEWQWTLLFSLTLFLLPLNLAINARPEDD